MQNNGKEICGRVRLYGVKSSSLGTGGRIVGGRLHTGFRAIYQHSRLSCDLPAFAALARGYGATTAQTLNWQKKSWVGCCEAGGS